MDLVRDIERRKREMYQFYYLGIGTTIKRKRLERKMTQEVLAKGICSNTYISKLENNQIVVNKESLYLIMEKMDIPKWMIRFPEDMIEDLEKSLYYFFHHDVEKYKSIFDNSVKYEFAVLLEVIELGYYTLIGDLEKAQKVYVELLNYVSALEDFGLTIFSIYSCFLLVEQGKFSEAKVVLEQINDHLYMRAETIGLLSELKFRVYGNLGFHYIASIEYERARMAYSNRFQSNRLAILKAQLNLYFVYEGLRNHISHSDEILDFLTPLNQNLYLIFLSIEEEEPLKYLEKVKVSGGYYLDSLYLKCLYYRRKGQMDLYSQTKQELRENTFDLVCEMDYIRLLELEEKNEIILYKDMLINHMIPYLQKIQNVYLIKLVNRKICRILEERKRYKDVLTNQIRVDKFISKIRGCNPENYYL